MSVLVLLLLALRPSGLPAREPGRLGVTLAGQYSIPVGGLTDWFEPAPALEIAAGRQYDDRWYLEGVLSYTRFNDENLKGYARGKIDLSLEYSGILVQGYYSFKPQTRWDPYMNVGAGIFYWKGIRGEIDPDNTVEPSIPFIEERVLEEWNWGFRTGAGMAFHLTEALTLDLKGYYQFVVGDLWPTLQPHIELEGVSGFQSLNLALQVRYFF